MALLFDHGVVQWLTSDAATSTKVINTMSFQPKAIRFYWVGIQNAADAASGAVDEQRGVGFATSTSDRRCVATFSDDAAGTMACVSMARNDAIACTLAAASTTASGLLDITAFASNGFTLTVDDTAGQNLTIFWEAWGGDDITVAACVDIAEPAATGTQDYTVTGFTSDGLDQVVMFAGVQSTAALNTGLVESSTLSVGFASGINASQNINVVGSNDHGSTTADSDGACFTGECISSIALAGAAVKDARAALTAFGTNLFTLNWAERAVTNRRRIALAIKGGGWAAGSFTINNGTPGNTATVSGLPFAPKGISLIGTNTTEDASDTAHVQDRIGFGTGTGTGSRRAMGVLDEDNSTSGSSVCEVSTVVEYDQVLAFPGTADTLDSAYDINAMNNDGFELIVDDSPATTSTTEWIGYLAFGNNPIPPDINVAPMRAPARYA